MIDCLIIGQNDFNFEAHINMVRFAFGKDSGAYQDQDYVFINVDGRPKRIIDVLNMANPGFSEKPLSHLDFLWPTIMALGSHLKKNGLTYDYVNQFALEKDLLKEKLLNNEYRSIAISTTLYISEFPIIDVVRFIRKYRTDIPIIIGGPYVQNRTTEGAREKLDGELSHLGGDIYVDSSEGQQALVNIISALNKNRSLYGIDNVIYRRKGDFDLGGNDLVVIEAGSEGTFVGDNFVFNKKSIESNDLKDSVIDWAEFKDGMNEFATVSTAKSCPYSCAFCSFPTRAGKYKYTGVEAVEHQLNQLKDAGVTTITFIDDTFNVPKGRFKEILQMMIRNRYGFKWNSFYRSDQGDSSVIDLMAESGCEGVFIGMESGCNGMLKRMAKTSRVEDYAAAITQFSSLNIHTHANFILGFPGETEGSIQRTIDFVNRYKPTSYKAQLWYLEKNSPIWNMRDQYSLTGSGFDWTHETMNAKEGARWVDYAYDTVTNSQYIPLEGFGWWVFFYLDRMGMSKDSIFKTLKLFYKEVSRKRKAGDDPSITQSDFSLLLDAAKIIKIDKVVGVGKTSYGEACVVV